ncbi:MAG: polyamine ABC transporter substrate-binding protein [Pseudomonadales bacterium]
MIVTRLRFVALAVGLLGLAACGGTEQAGGSAPAKLVNFYNWSDYIDDRSLPDFTAETGIRVRYDVYDSNDVLEGKLLAGNTGYDVVVPTGNYFELQRTTGIYQPLDKSKLANYGNLDPDILAKIEPLDPGNLHAVPYAWGTTGLGLDVAKISARIPDAPLDSWELLFDPEHARRLADCGITLLDAPDEIDEIVLNYLGYPPASADPRQLEEAMALVAEIRPYVRYFHSSQYIDDFANGEVCLVMGWSGDLYQAMNDARQGLDLRYVIPREGTVLWFDLMAVPADAPNPDNAHALIDYLLRPEVAARITNKTFFANGNLASLPLVDAEIRDDPAIYPPPEVMERLFPNPVKEPSYVRSRNRLWTRVKTGL